MSTQVKTIEGDIRITQDTAFDFSVHCTGKLVVEPGVTLTTSRYETLETHALEVYGTLKIAGEGEGFKPGHVYGKEADNPLAVRVETDLLVDGGTIEGKEAVVAANGAVFRKDVRLTGMIGFDHLLIAQDARVITQGGTWIITETMTVEDHVVFDLSETEICVLKSRKGEDLEGAKGGFYDHEGYGTTQLGQNVSVLGDDTFIWVWFGRVEGAFETIRGNVVLKTCGGIFTDGEDMANIETSEVTGTGTEEDPFRFTWHEIDPDYVYHNPRQLAIDAVVNNALQERLPGCLIFDFNKELFAFTEPHFRAGNVLIHELYFDPPTIRALADFRALATQI